MSDGVSPSSPNGASSDVAEYACAASIASTMSSGSTSSRSANSGMVGVLPSAPVISGRVWFNRVASSWSRRGTRMVHPLSRKWRLSSPTIVADA